MTIFASFFLGLFVCCLHCCCAAPIDVDFCSSPPLKSWAERWQRPPPACILQRCLVMVDGGPHGRLAARGVGGSEGGRRGAPAYAPPSRPSRGGLSSSASLDSETTSASREQNTLTKMESTPSVKDRTASRAGTREVLAQKRAGRGVMTRGERNEVAPRPRVPARHHSRKGGAIKQQFCEVEGITGARARTHQSHMQMQPK